MQRAPLCLSLDCVQMNGRIPKWHFDTTNNEPNFISYLILNYPLRPTPILPPWYSQDATRIETRADEDEKTSRGSQGQLSRDCARKPAAAGSRVENAPSSC